MISAGFDEAVVVDEQNPIPLFRHVDPIRRVAEFAGFNEVGGILSLRGESRRDGKCQKDAGHRFPHGKVDLARMVAERR